MNRLAGPGLASVLIHVVLLTYLSGFAPVSPTPSRSTDSTPISMAFKSADASRSAKTSPTGEPDTARSDPPQPAPSPRNSGRASPASDPNPAPEPRSEPAASEPRLVSSRTGPSNRDHSPHPPVQPSRPMPSMSEPGVQHQTPRTPRPTRTHTPPSPDPVQETTAPEPSRPGGSKTESRPGSRSTVRPVSVGSPDRSGLSGQPDLLARSNSGKSSSSSLRSQPVEPARPGSRMTREPSRIERPAGTSSIRPSPPPAPKPSLMDSRQKSSPPDVRASARNRGAGSSTDSTENPPVRVSRSDTSAGAPGTPSGVHWVENVRYRSNPSPSYPQKARVLGMEGRVLLRVDIDRRGRPIRVRVRKSSGHYLLDRAAREAVRGWSFEPARRQGQPVPSRTVIPIRFTLQR